MDGIKILHISDLHFGPPYRPMVGEALLSIAEALSPDFIAVSGDLTQRAKRDQFEAARKFIDQLPDVPKVVVPGNHDVPLYRIPERLAQPHGLYSEIIHPELNPVLEMPGAIIQGLDTTAPTRAITNRRIYNRQLALCAETFRQAPPSKMRIIVAHHPFIPAPDTRKSRAMQKSKRALDTLIDLNVELILGGHLHSSYVGSSFDFLSSRKHERGIIIAQAGTSTSSRGLGKELGRNSFNFIEIDDRSVVVSNYLYFESLREFRKFSMHTLPRAKIGHLD